MGKDELWLRREVKLLKHLRHVFWKSNRKGERIDLGITRKIVTWTKIRRIEQ